MHQQMNNMAEGLYHQIEELAKQVSSNKEETGESKREKLCWKTKNKEYTGDQVQRWR